jgi:hypothetical protein
MAARFTHLGFDIEARQGWTPWQTWDGPRATGIAEPKRSHGPLVTCALSPIPTECGGVQFRSETKRPSTVEAGRSIGANGCQATNHPGCGVGAVDTFVAPDHLGPLHCLLHSVGGQHPEDHWHTG